MRGIKTAAIIFSCVFAVIFFMLIVFIFMHNNDLINLFSALSSVFATIAFGFWVSFSFQYINDKNRRVKEKDLIQVIRNREFGRLNYTMAVLVRDFYMHEDQLIHKIKGIKSSFSKNTIDIENLTLNFFIFSNIVNNLEKIFKDEKDRQFIKTNIDYLFMKDEKGTMGIDGEMFSMPEIYCDFSDFNDECIRLYKVMQQLNLDYQLEIFSDKEIKAVSFFSNKINIGWFVNFDPPYEIIVALKGLLEIELFINADFVPYYKKENFWSDIEKKDQQGKEHEEKINKWREENNKKALLFLSQNKLGE